MQEQATKNVLNQFISYTTSIDFAQSFTKFDQILGDKFQGNMALSMFTETPCVFTIEEHIGPFTIPYEVGPKKILHINAGLSEDQQA